MEVLDPLLTPGEDGQLSAADIARGVGRLLVGLGHAPLLEFALGDGRRADIFAIGRKGLCTIVEIKSSRADLLADRKWPDYLAHADAFYFAVAPGFPQALLPTEEGLILADRHAGVIARTATPRPLAPARRKALLLRFARTAALRLQLLHDPMRDAEQSADDIG